MAILQPEPTLAEHPAPSRPSSIAYVCPLCRGPLALAPDGAQSCHACNRCYAVRNGQPDFRPDADDPLNEPSKMDEIERWQNRLKLFLRQSPGLYRFLIYTIAPTLILGPSSQRFVQELGPDAKVLSIGAGVMRLKGNVTHLDYEPYTHLEVVGDALYLPFPDNSFDGAVCETMLEHVLEPDRVLSEMKRVLKPGGKCYVVVPFIHNFHAAPSDFYRFTHRGLQYMMEPFITHRLQVVSGPTSALITILMDWLALFFSFGSRKLYHLLGMVFMVMLCPLKLLDFAMTHHPEAIRIACTILYIGQKPDPDQPGG